MNMKDPLKDLLLLLRRTKKHPAKHAKGTFLSAAFEQKTNTNLRIIKFFC